ncbi:PREDICTED: V-type proton ATPase subunit G2-like [Brassica oleracea var. oleracea]|uniref:V-type proton ATPase subunit G2-like n=1 Tax=Brassica oleracea var. oleracea TaxID=109376 RepID=UPI0006A7537F|nr:PREDICTED: V-type proton ATPase subunit G2-like [Brassica oleracea var. oleracea]
MRGLSQVQVQHGIIAVLFKCQQMPSSRKTSKMARLKQAKEEAETEVAEHKTSTEHGFQRKLEETSGDSGANVKRLEQETDAKIEHLKNEASRTSRDVVDMLLKHVTTVKN